ADSMEQEHLKELAAKVQAYADVLVIIGVGGANQAARAVIEAFGQKHDQVQIIYAGTNLSPDYLSALTRGSSG
ncbi:MAG: glucose-6-phosphate isomerase, partial [Loigolactobacillus coryniformis]|nr:glucose-6-phosphate isomerase [Loigolactobacillus coryniformis]